MRPDRGARADPNRPEPLGARPDDDVLFQGRVPLPFFPAGASEGHAMVERDIRADLGRLADHHAHAVIDEQTGTEPGAGVDLDPGEGAAKVRNEPAGPAQAQAPERVRDPVEPEGVQARIGGEYFPPAPRRRIAVEDRAQVAA